MNAVSKDFLRRLARTRKGNCPSTAMLGAYHDEELSDEERERVEGHLRACPACNNELIDLRELAVLAKEGERAPARLVDRIMSETVPGTAGDTTGPSGTQTSSIPTESGSWLQKLRDLFATPSKLAPVAGGAFALVIGLALVLQLNRAPEFDPFLTPRGGISPLEQIREATIELNVPGVASTGIVIATNQVVSVLSAAGASGGEPPSPAMLSKDDQTPLVLLERPATASPVALLATQIELTDLEVVILDDTGEPFLSRVGSSGLAEWQDGPLPYQGQLIEYPTGQRPIAAGTGIYARSGELVGLHLFVEDGAGFGLEVQEIQRFLENYGGE